MAKENKFLTVRTMVYLAVLTAIQIVLARFLSINMWNFRFGLSFVPLVICGKMFGPKGGMIQSGLSDFLGAILFPTGQYFPGFTLTGVLNGFLYGYFLQKPTKKNVFLLILLSELVCSLLINTFWISVLYGSPFVSLLSTRALQSGATIVMKIFVIPVVLELEKLISKATASVRG